jgi:uncharacterized membrane protein YjjB (DUF3815 family)
VAALLVGGELWPRRSKVPRAVLAIAAVIVIVPTLLASGARLLS